MKRLLFLITTAVLFLIFGFVLWKDMNRDWTKYQHQFKKTLSPPERRGVPGGIQQVILDDLDRVDRCTTCHVAIDKPQIALAEEPFTAHPGDYLKWHPVEKFGCTVCHGGQGLATDVKAAHGEVLHWEEPLLRGDLVQASCASCHGDLQPIAVQAPLLVQGKALFEAKGCFGCHTVKDFGGTLSVELTAVGSKPYQLIHADFEMMDHPHDRIRWIMAKLDHPRLLNPGVRPEQLPPGEEEVFPTAMPHFGLNEDETKALTVYLLSLRELDPPASYVTAAPPQQTPQYASQVEWGKAVFEKFGCTGCHGAGGLGGRHNWNAALGAEVPPLVYARAYYSEDQIKDVIRNGRQPAYRDNVNKPVPSIYMPAWKEKLSEMEIDALVAYIFSLYDRIAPPPAQAALAPAAEAPAAPESGTPAATE